MSLEKLVEKYGEVTSRFYDGKIVGKINGYEIEIEKTPNVYSLYLNLNGGIRKFFETESQLESFLNSLN
jgi:hypothetical protein